jgi:phosphoribosylformylglycinamidine cyclo-ligase
VTHVSERSGAGGANRRPAASGDRQPWTGGTGRSGRRRTVTYADAGVSIHAGERAVELLKSKVHRTLRPEVMGDIGGFAGLFRLNVQKYRNPVLASSTDGVGTKLVIAQQLDIHDTVGIDLVAMVADDLVACGAEPLFLLDYIACGEVVPDKVAEIGAGIADGCRYAGCALLGGETAEHPGVLRPDEYDISATGVGVVEESEIRGRDRVEVGDVVIAMRSSGLHSNGYSLVRHVLLGAGRMRLDTVVEDFGPQRTLGEELLTPTKIYTRAAADLRPDPGQGPDRECRDGVDVQHGRRHVRDRVRGRRRPGAGVPGRPGDRGVAGGRDHRGVRDGADDRPAHSRVSGR